MIEMTPIDFRGDREATYAKSHKLLFVQPSGHFRIPLSSSADVHSS